MAATKKVARKRAASGRSKRKIRAPIERVDNGGVDFEKEGLLANIDRLREAEKNAAEDYFKAKQSGQLPEVVGAVHNEWLRTSEQLRKAEVSTPEVLAKVEQTVPIEDVEALFVKMVTEFRVAMEALPRSLPPRLVGLDEAGVQEVLAKAVTENLTKLSEAQWKPKL